ncbi:MAG: excinuclease ABC subunit UvrA [Paludibacteraceae bacterium]|nr:excinuclease ABC subunit UvrA [Paludibacteraceae bacterium]
MKQGNDIIITGARVHNLKNIDVRIPRDKLVVITGLSGSGKSSLAFDTIFAEGQRRYMETFSSYARGYIGTMQRPDVDKITGLSPVISIDQKTTSRNPRSTVGTVTEVYDFLRLLFARAADAYSYASGEKMVQYTDDQILDLILKEYAGQKVLILAPMVNNRKGHYKELFETIRRKGYLHVRVDGEVQEITPGMKLDRYKNHTIEVVVDRLKVKGERLEVRGEEIGEDLKRLRATVDKAMTQGDGVMAISVVQNSSAVVQNGSASSLRYFSRHLMCPTTGMSYAEPAPHTFSFNSPQGWCPCCRGLGKVKGERLEAKGDEELDNIIKDDDNWYTRMLAYVQQGDEEKEEKEEQWVVCPACQGQRLSREALSFRIADKNIAELSAMDITDLRAWLMNVPAKLSNKQRAIAEPIIKEIISRLGFMLSVGLSYLSLSRSSDSLSGGENQRIRLATQVGSKLVNVLYILDEPSIGLHQRDNQRLIDSLKQLRDMGNSIIVVEHDEDMMRQADYIIDIGPKAGRLGGHIVFSGTPAELLKSDTLTAKYLSGELSATLPLTNSQSPIATLPSLQGGDGGRLLVLRGCKGNNLKGVDVSFPLGQMIAVTGVSGSGKSTLINQTLYPILSQHFYRSLRTPLAYDSIEGIEHIDKVIGVDQSPIGRTPRSNPATYTGVFTDIRNLFAQLPESKIRSWKAGRFSFNNAGGRCEECSGNGYKTIQMHFLPNVYVPCEVCGGQRYNRETLEARFKGKSIAEVLDMTINQAVEFFESQPYILKKIKTLQDVGLGYIKLGQSSTTLSGGESQRVKLATELARPGTGNTLYILDEPTTGLHFEDVRVLMGVLRRLVDKGNTVIIIEHNPDVIRSCDYIVDMGPDGGREGGTVVATGTVEDLRNNPHSITGRYI